MPVRSASCLCWFPSWFSQTISPCRYPRPCRGWRNCLLVLVKHARGSALGSSTGMQSGSRCVIKGDLRARSCTYPWLDCDTGMPDTSRWSARSRPKIVQSSPTRLGCCPFSRDPPHAGTRNGRVIAPREARVNAKMACWERKGVEAYSVHRKWLGNKQLRYAR